MKDKYEFMQVLTSRTDLGVEFVERFQLARIAVAVVFPVMASAILAILYSIFTGDVSSAFTVSSEIFLLFFRTILAHQILRLFDWCLLRMSCPSWSPEFGRIMINFTH